MAHNDIYTKFMIEYDKAGGMTSYPSLTEYEVATVLDKAYNALISQKVTGNNIRGAGFETDLKAVEDLAPLVVESIENVKYDEETGVKITRDHMIDNRLTYERPKDMLYFVDLFLYYSYPYKGGQGNHGTKDFEVPIDHSISASTVRDHGHVVDYTAHYPVDRLIPTKLVSHAMAKKFQASTSNIPWIKIPVCYLENSNIYVLYDTFMFDKNQLEFQPDAQITYIKKPNTFVKDLEDINQNYDREGTYSYFNCDANAPEDVKSMYEFECNSTVAEELISLAVSFALENVESQRLNSKLNMRGLEA